MLFPGNLTPFCSYRRFTGLTGVCASSSTFCRLVTAKLSSYSWKSFWISLVSGTLPLQILSSFLMSVLPRSHCGTLSPVVVVLRYLAELNCTKFNRPRSTQVQFRTALTAVYAGGENSCNSSIEVGGAVIRKFGPISQFGDFRSKLSYTTRLPVISCCQFAV